MLKNQEPATWIVWPEKRWVAASTIRMWYRDAVENEELDSDCLNATDLETMKRGLSDAGIITLATPREMTEKSAYAREGYRFYSVNTPTFFLEYELPERVEDMTDDDHRKMERLEQEAGNHRCYVHSSPYEIG